MLETYSSKPIETPLLNCLSQTKTSFSRCSRSSKYQHKLKLQFLDAVLICSAPFYVSPAAEASESVHMFILADVNPATVAGLDYRVLNCHVLLLCFVLLPYLAQNVRKTWKCICMLSVQITWNFHIQFLVLIRHTAWLVMDVAVSHTQHRKINMQLKCGGFFGHQN